MKTLQQFLAALISVFLCMSLVLNALAANDESCKITVDFHNCGCPGDSTNIHCGVNYPFIESSTNNTVECSDGCSTVSFGTPLPWVIFPHLCSYSTSVWHVATVTASYTNPATGLAMNTTSNVMLAGPLQRIEVGATMWAYEYPPPSTSNRIVISVSGDGDDSPQKPALLIETNWFGLSDIAQVELTALCYEWAVMWQRATRDIKHNIFELPKPDEGIIIRK